MQETGAGAGIAGRRVKPPRHRERRRGRSVTGTAAGTARKESPGASGQSGIVDEPTSITPGDARLVRSRVPSAGREGKQDRDRLSMPTQEMAPAAACFVPDFGSFVYESRDDQIANANAAGTWCAASGCEAPGRPQLLPEDVSPRGQGGSRVSRGAHEEPAPRIERGSGARAFLPRLSAVLAATLSGAPTGIAYQPILGNCDPAGAPEERPV
jgi:hypothetical protein